MSKVKIEFTKHGCYIRIYAEDDELPTYMAITEDELKQIYDILKGRFEKKESAFDNPAYLKQCEVGLAAAIEKIKHDRDKTARLLQEKNHLGIERGPYYDEPETTYPTFKD